MCNINKNSVKNNLLVIGNIKILLTNCPYHLFVPITHFNNI